LGNPRLRLAANGDDVAEKLTRLENIEDGLRLVLRNIEAAFAHHFHHERIQRAGLQAGALRLEFRAADIVQERFGHLAARAVVNTYEEDSWLVHILHPSLPS
jgi:hypothetical protein